MKIIVTTLRKYLLKGGWTNLFIINTLLCHSKDDCFGSHCVKNIFIVVDHVWVGGIVLPHWASLAGSSWARETCVCTVCVCSAELWAEEPRQPACSNCSAHTPVLQLASSLCSRWCLGFSRPTWVIWITHWTKYTLLEALERKQRFFRVARVMWVASPAQLSSLCELLY